jgi:hypothetical protein
MDSNDLNFGSTDELRKALQDWARGQQPAPQEPQVPGLPAGLSKEAQNAAAKSYADAILAKPVGTWTPQEREFIGKATVAALREYGY